MAAAAVLSALAQDDPDFELLVVDDGSTDDTRKVLAKLPKDPRFQVHPMDKNRGQHFCRNEAIRRSKGRYITFLDSDDLYLPERLTVFRKAIETRPEAGFWFSNAYVQRFGRIIGLLFDRKRKIPQGKVPGYYAVGDEYLPYVTTNVVVRREAFDKFGFFREDLKILEDTELYARMLGGGLEVGAVNEPLSVRVLHETQITGDYARDFEESLLALKAAKPPPEVMDRKRRELVIEVATYLLKGLKPVQAREFLEDQLGEPAKSLRVHRRTFTSPGLLKFLKSLRAAYLKLRYSSPLAPLEYRKTSARVLPYTEFASRL